MPRGLKGSFCYGESGTKRKRGLEREKSLMKTSAVGLQVGVGLFPPPLWVHPPTPSSTPERDEKEGKTFGRGGDFKIKCKQALITRIRPLSPPPFKSTRHSTQPARTVVIILYRRVYFGGVHRAIFFLLRTSTLAGLLRFDLDDLVLMMLLQ